MPKVSVLFPARNAARWVDAALASILRQSERDLEVVAIDDGSTDDTADRIARAARADPRVHLVRTVARGLPAALETARGAATGAFVARQDADDVSHPRRLSLQVAHLRAHPDLAVVGSRVSLFPAGRVAAGMRRWALWHNALLTHEAMAADALVDSVLCHGTAVFRADALAEVGGWRDVDGPEDVDLWLRMLARGQRLGKLPRTLYAWRQRATSATRTDPRYGADRFRALKADALAALPLARTPGGVTLVGVGRSLAAWSDALAARGVEYARVEAARPVGEAWTALGAPGVRLVLVFGARPARERWRAALTARGRVERDDFVFVA